METSGFTVLTAANGREAVEIFRQTGGQICLVLLDLTMPYLDGEETLRELRRIRNDVRAILISGYSEQTVTKRFVDKGVAEFIQKPFGLDDLLATVRKVLEAPPNDKI
jgi:DNA-binding response OmpR family regulator